MSKETKPSESDEIYRVARLMVQPAASAAALASLTLGFTSQAMGIWTGIATGALQASQRLFAPGRPQQRPAAAEPERSRAPAVLTVVEGGAAKRPARPQERAAPTEPTGQEVGRQNGSPAKAPTKAIQNAANSAAALGDPETGKEFARKAEAKTAEPVVVKKAKSQGAETSKQQSAQQKSEPVAAETSRPQAAETIEPQAEKKLRLARANPATAEARKPAANPPSPALRRPNAEDRPEAPDNLKAISGIGPKLEKVLNGLGIWTYAQLAGLAEGEIAWLEDHLGFGGRIGRDDWIGQAKALAPTKQ